MISCFRFAHKEAYKQGLHQHEEGQFFILLQGAVAFITSEGEWVMTAGRPCWVPPNTDHGVVARSEMMGISIHLSPDLCADLPEQIAILKSSEFIDQLATHMLGCNDDTLRLMNLWRVLADEIMHAERDDFYLPAPKDARLRSMAEQLAQNPADPRNLAGWAAEVCMAERTLVRRFRSETGMSFVAWRQRARVLLAIKLLGAGESVTQVAMTVGYDSLSAFISVFRQLTGVAPLQYLRTTSDYQQRAAAESID